MNDYRCEKCGQYGVHECREFVYVLVKEPDYHEGREGERNVLGVTDDFLVALEWEKKVGHLYFDFVLNDIEK